MSIKLRIATFNLENFDDSPPVRPEIQPTFAERIALMRPQLIRLDADILCFQEVHGQGNDGQHFTLRALEAFLADTPYNGFNSASTGPFVSSELPEDINLPIDTIPPAGQHPLVNNFRNLVLLTRFNILEGRQIKYTFVTPPFYKPVTAQNPQTGPIRLERPLLYVRVSLSPTQHLHIIVVHLKSKIPVDIPGQKITDYVWRTPSGRAEGSFISSMMRLSQALEVRRIVDNLFDQDENALIAVCGDFNSDQSEVPLEAIRGDIEDTENPQLTKRVLVPCEKSIPESSRYSLFHHGKGNMLDHIMVSRSLLAYYRGAEIHNELLHDKSAAHLTDKMLPESDHAPVIAHFELPS